MTFDIVKVALGFLAIIVFTVAVLKRLISVDPIMVVEIHWCLVSLFHRRYRGVETDII